MPEPNEAALRFLLTRRSRPVRMLRAPAPDRAALRPLLQAALRTPDHGKLEPWRLMVLERPALARLAGLVAECGTRLGRPSGDIAKARAAFDDSPLAVAVIEVQRPPDKVPPIEQSASAACVCLGLLNAALAAGWGANWLTGWVAHDRDFMTAALALASHERIAGFIHVGTETAAPPDRPRPDVDTLTTWVRE